MNTTTLESKSPKAVKADAFSSFDLYKKLTKLIDAFEELQNSYNTWGYKAQAIGDLGEIQSGDGDLRFFPEMIAALGEDLRNDIWRCASMSDLIAAMDDIRTLQEQLSGVPKGS